jgi:hypothetical protein
LRVNVGHPNEPVGGVLQVENLFDVSVKLRLERSDLETMSSGRITKMTSVERAVVGFAALDSIDDSAYESAVDLRSEFGDDEGGVVFAGTFLG